MDMVGGWPIPLKNMSSSIGMMTFPIYGKIKHVPKHQPGCGCFANEILTAPASFHFKSRTVPIFLGVPALFMMTMPGGRGLDAVPANWVDSRVTFFSEAKTKNKKKEVFISFTYSCPLVNVYKKSMARSTIFAWENSKTVMGHGFNSYAKLPEST